MPPDVGEAEFPGVTADNYIYKNSDNLDYNGSLIADEAISTTDLSADLFELNIPETIYGTNFDDILTNQSFNNSDATIYAYDGDDKVASYIGNDLIILGHGDDSAVKWIDQIQDFSNANDDSALVGEWRYYYSSNGATTYENTVGQLFFGGLIDTKGDTADLSFSISVNDQTYNFTTTISSNNPFPTAIVSEDGAKLVALIPAELGTDKYSFTGALLDFDMSTGVPITTPTDAAGTVTISPLSLVTYTLVDDENVSTEHGMQQDPFTFNVIGQDGPPMSLFMHRAETNLNIDWLVTNSQVDGNEGNDTIHLIGEREDIQ